MDGSPAMSYQSIIFLRSGWLTRVVGRAGRIGRLGGDAHINSRVANWRRLLRLRYTG
jgi:hypothetical protein